MRLRSNAFAITLAIALVTATGIPLSLLGFLNQPETKALSLYPTSDLGVYERQIEFEWFSSTVNVKDTDVGVSGYFSLEKFVWLELSWETDTGEHKVRLDSFPTSAVYECKRDNIEFYFCLSLHGITVRVRIPFEHRGLPTLTFAYYSPLG